MCAHERICLKGVLTQGVRMLCRRKFMKGSGRAPVGLCHWSVVRLLDGLRCVCVRAAVRPSCDGRLPSSPPNARTRARHLCSVVAPPVGIIESGPHDTRVYQNGPGLLRRDKYWGRSLDEMGFKGALRRFFHSGRHLRVAVVRRVIAKLEELRRAIERQTSYRFYSCSLLVVYEGNPDSNQGCSSSHHDDLHTCNLDGDSSVSQESHRRGFAEAAARGSSTSSNFVPISEETVFPDPSPHELIPDVGANKSRPWLNHSSLSGPETSSDLDLSLESTSSGGSAGNKRSRLSPGSEGWTDFLATSVSSDFELSASSCSECTPTKRIRQLSHCSDSNVDDEDEEDDFPTPLKSCTQRCEASNIPPNVDVRMIDFAHTTCHGDPGPSTLHLGPDGGFLTGLDSLRRLLREILSEG